MKTTQDIYFSAVLYQAGGNWFPGPSGDSYEQVRNALRAEYGLRDCHVFKATLPVHAGAEGHNAKDQPPETGSANTKGA